MVSPYPTCADQQRRARGTPGNLRLRGALHGTHAPCDDGAMRIGSTTPTSLFVGTPQRPLQIVRVTLVTDQPDVDDEAGPIVVRVEGTGVGTPLPLSIPGVMRGAGAQADVPVAIAAPHDPGSRLSVTSSRRRRPVGARPRPRSP